MKNQNKLEKSSLEIKEVEFNGVTLLGIKKDNKVFVGVKKICEDLGLDNNAQLQRIKRTDVLKEGVCIISTPSKGGLQETYCLDVDFLPFFLTGIKINKCKESIRPYLLDFQLKAKDVLIEAFIKKETTGPAPEKTLTQSEILLNSVQLLVEIEKRQIETETTVKNLVNYQNQNRARLNEVERSDLIPFAKTTRSKIRELVNTYVGASGLNFTETWNKLYTEMLLRYSIDVFKRSKSRNISKLDCIQEAGLIEELFAVASEVLFIPNENNEIG